MAFDRLGRCQDHRRGAIVDPRGIARSDGLVRAVDRLEFAQGFQAGIGTRMLVVLNHRLTFFMGNTHRHDFFGKVACGLGSSSPLLAAQGESVLIGAGNLVLVGHVVRRLWHRVDTVLGFHQRVDKAPANGGVLQFHVARERGIGLAHHKRRPRHGLDATGNRQLHLAAGNGAERRADGIHTRGTQAVEGHAGNGVRQPGQQRGHARHVAVVFTGLVGAAEKYFVDFVPVHIRVAFDQRLDRRCRQIIGAHACQATAKTADRGTNRVTDKDFAHHASPGA